MKDFTLLVVVLHYENFNKIKYGRKIKYKIINSKTSLIIKSFVIFFFQNENFSESGKIMNVYFLGVIGAQWLQSHSQPLGVAFSCWTDANETGLLSDSKTETAVRGIKQQKHDISSVLSEPSWYADRAGLCRRLRAGLGPQGVILKTRITGS